MKITRIWGFLIVALSVLASSIEATSQDLTNPTAIAKNVDVYLNSSGVGTLNVSELNNGSTDNVAVDSIAIISSSFAQMGVDSFGLGTSNHLDDRFELSSDGGIVALGDPYSNSYGGLVNIMQWNGTSWNALGSSITGSNYERAGFSVSLSGDGHTVVIGSPEYFDLNYGMPETVGAVRVWDWNGTAWTQRGTTIQGVGEYERAGSIVKVTSDGNTIAVLYNSIFGYSTSKIKVFKWNGTGWVQQGSDIVFYLDTSDPSISLSSDGNTLAIGTPDYYSTSKVQVYQWNGTSWGLKGAALQDGAYSSNFGSSVCLSASGNTVVVGAPWDSNGGSARIYDWDSTAWVQRGSTIYGAQSTDQAGSSVSLSADGYTVAVGSPFNGSNGTYAGATRVFKWDGTSWTQLNTAINGRTHERNGAAVKLSSNGLVLASGSQNYSSNWCFVSVFSRTDILSEDFTCSDLGKTYSRSLRVYDAALNTDYSSASVTIMDSIDPVISAQNVTVLLDASGSASVDSNDVDLGSTDNCGISTMSLAQSTFGCADLGANVVTYTVTDNSGNSSSLDVTITVNDTTPPTYTDQSATVSLDASGIATVDSASVAVGLSDNCGISTLVLSKSSFTVADLGSNAITVTATDASGNSTTVSATITVIDSVVPTAIAKNVTVYLDSSGIGTLLASELNNGSTDNIGVDSIAIISGMFAQLGVDSFGLGTASDIGYRFDLSSDGRIVALGDPYSNGYNGSVNISQWNGTSWNPLGSSIIGSTSEQTGASVSLSGDGHTVVIGFPGFSISSLFWNEYVGAVRVFDWNGTTWIQRGLQIQGESDSKRAGPVVKISSDGNTIACAYKNYSGYSNLIKVFRWNGTAWIQQGSEFSVSSDFEDAVFSLSSDGNIIAIGAVNMWSPSVQVHQWNGASWDLMGSALQGSEDSDFGTSVCLSSSGHTVAIGVPNDNYGGSARIYDWNSTSWIQRGSDIIDSQSSYGVGYSVSLSADGQTVAVGSPYNQDNGTFSGETRVFKWNGLSWAQLGADVEGRINEQNGIAVKLSSNGSVLAAGSRHRSSNLGFVNVFGLSDVLSEEFTCSDLGGTYSRTLNVYDAAHNVAEASANVTILDTIPPTVQAQNVTVLLDASGSASVDSNQVDLGSTDNCGISTMSLAQSTFGCSDLGANVVTYTVTDKSGNSSSLDVTITVNDTTPPTYTAQSATVSLDASGTATVDSAAVAVGLSDNCEISTLVLSKSSFTVADLGSNNITVTATDASGNFTTVSAIITVIDSVAPMAVAKNVTVYLDSSGVGTLLASDLNNGSTDNVGVDSIAIARMLFGQIGLDIDGDTTGYHRGRSVSTSSDGSVVAIGGGDTYYGAGSVSVFEWDGSSWGQRGVEIFGETVGDYFGNSVSLSADGSIVAIGAPYNTSTHGYAGHVRVYQWDGSNWNQLGVDIDGDSPSEQTGGSVSLAADGLTLAIGARENDDNGNNAGQVRVYSWNGTDWIQKGSDLNGEAADDYAGTTVSISSDGSVVVVGSQGHDFNGTNSGRVRVFEWDGSAWVLQGQNIDGTIGGEQSGYSVNLSSDGTILAIGAPYNSVNGSYSGQVRVYSYNGTSWSQLGQNIQGDSPYDYFGSKLSLSGDGKTIAIGSYGQNSPLASSGLVKIYSWNGSSWVQSVSNIYGEAANDNSGRALSISSDGSAVAIGSEYNSNSNGSNSGHVRIFKLPELMKSESFSCSDLDSSYTRNLMVFDAANNSATATAIVTIQDAVQPIILTNNPSVYLNASGVATVDSSQVIAQLSDNCSISSTSISKTSFTVADVGSNTIDVTATDGSGNVKTVQATVYVLDSIAPMAIAKIDTVYLDSTGNGVLLAADLNNGSTDNIGIDSLAILKSLLPQMGASINGETNNNYTGWSTSLSADGTTVVVGSKNYQVNGENLGLVRVYSWMDTAWVQKGADIYGESDGCENGYSVSISSDGSTVAIGAIFGNDSNSIRTGHVRVFDWSGSSWTKRGLNLEGDSQYDQFGYNVSLSADGLSVAVGAPGKDSIYSNAGQIKVYYWNGSRWIAKGSSFRGEAYNASIGMSFDLSANGSVLAIGDPYYQSRKGRVQIFEWQGSLWTQRGADIEGYITGGAAGTSVSLSADGARVAIGVPYGTSYGYKSEVFIQSWNGVEWTPLGQRISGESYYGSDDQFGFSVAISGDGSTVAVGAPSGYSGTIKTGRAQLFKLSGGTWVNKGESVYGESWFDYFGQVVSLSSDGSRAAISTPYSSAIAGNSGQVRLFDFSEYSSETFTCSDIDSTYTRILKVYDESNNWDYASTSVTILDTTSPTILAQNLTVYLDSTGSASIDSSDVDLGSTDNCAVVSMELGQSNFDCSDLGVKNVTYTVTDNSSNSSTQELNITVVDDILPTLLAQNITVYLDATGSVSIDSSDVDLGSSDNCSIASMTLSKSSFDCSEIGLNTVTYTVADVSGNSRSMDLSITVLDVTNPVLSLQNPTVYLDATGYASVSQSDVDLGTTDNCGIATFDLSRTSFSCADAGNHNVTVTVTDVNGNSSSADVIVTVVDDIAPVIAVQDITVALDSNGTVTVTSADIDNGSSDNCSFYWSFNRTLTYDCTDIGAHIVRATITDSAGNADSEYFIVNVVDNIAPVLVVQPATVYLNASGLASIVESDVIASLTDNCSSSPNVTLSRNWFQCLDLGAQNITITAVDAWGNQSVQTATVNVVDSTSPTLLVSDSVTVYASLGLCTAPAVWSVAANDNCSYTVTSTHSNGMNFTVGNHVVTTTVTDPSGNTVSANTYIVVMDTVSPALTSAGGVSQMIPSNCGANVTWTAPLFTDGCGVQSVSSNYANGSYFTVGTHTVLFTATDVNGNTSNSSLTFTVTDMEAPVVTAPANITVSNDASQCGAMVTLPSIVATDNCVLDTVYYSTGTTSFFGKGTTTVTAIAIDEAGNQSSKTFTVTVNDTEAPVAQSVPSDQVLGYCNSVVFYSLPTFSDNCSGVTVQQIAGLGSGATFPAGLTTNTFVATDASGNMDTVSFTIQIVGQYAPMLPTVGLICSSDNVIDLTVGSSIGVSFSGDYVSGNLFSPSQAGAGRHYINYSFQDSMGCVSTGVLQVVVAQAPTRPVVVRQGANYLSTQVFDRYQWYYNGSPIQGATSQSYIAANGGQYSVRVWNTTGCYETSVGLWLGVVGVEELTQESVILYPNPSTGSFSIDLSGLANKKVSYSIYDMAGRLLDSGTLRGGESHPMDMNDKASGVYQVVLFDEEGAVIVKRVVLQR